MPTSSSEITPATVFQTDPATGVHRVVKQSDPNAIFFTVAGFKELCAEGEYISVETAEDDLLNGNYFVWDGERFFEVWENRHAHFVQLLPLPANWEPSRATEYAEWRQPLYEDLD